MQHRSVQIGFAASSALCTLFQEQNGSFGQGIGAAPAPVPEQDNEAPRPGHRPRPLHDPHAVAERLMDWADAARLAGRTERADRLLLLAWDAYDRPARAPRRMSEADTLLAA